MKTKQQRKLAVLRDALAQIKAKKYRPSCGTVLELSGDEGWMIEGGSLAEIVENTDSDAQVKVILNEELPKKGNSCRVCARGSLLVSRIRLENKFKVEDLGNISGNSFDEENLEDQYLLKLFSERVSYDGKCI